MIKESHPKKYESKEENGEKESAINDDQIKHAKLSLRQLNAATQMSEEQMMSPEQIQTEIEEDSKLIMSLISKQNG